MARSRVGSCWDGERPRATGRAARVPALCKPLSPGGAAETASWARPLGPGPVPAGQRPPAAAGCGRVRRAPAPWAQRPSCSLVVTRWPFLCDRGRGCWTRVCSHTHAHTGPRRHTHTDTRRGTRHSVTVEARPHTEGWTTTPGPPGRRPPRHRKATVRAAGAAPARAGPGAASQGCRRGRREAAAQRGRPHASSRTGLCFRK